MQTKRSALLIVLLFIKVNLFCQPDSLQQDSPGILSAKVHYGSVLIHTPAIKNISGAKPLGFELEYSKQKKNSYSYNLCNCYPRTGIVASYYNFNNKILGSAIVAGYFLEPHYRINKAIQFFLRGSAGFTYATNPYNAITNPENHNYTVHLNPFFQVGGGFNYRLNNHISLTLMESLQHFSNGGYKQPNRGVNWLTSSAGIMYHPYNNFLPLHKKVKNAFWKNDKPRYDLGIMYVAKQGYNSKIKAQRKFLAGGFVQVTKQVGRTSALTGGAEIYYDKLVASPLTSNNASSTYLLAGVHAGHAFLLGKVSFTQQVGVYIYNKTNYFERIYLRFGLDYRIAKHWSFGVNLKSHTDNADFADARVMYRL